MQTKPTMHTLLAAGVAFACAGVTLSAQASSHREAPLITEMPKVDNTDFYMLNSYESGRDGFVTIISNWLPLQDAYGGPNYFSLDEDALYEIHIDSNGDSVEDITFQFQFDTEFRNIALPVGPNGQMVPIPLINAGPIDEPADPDTLNRVETYTIDVVRGARRTGVSQAVINASSGARRFTKPVDNIGQKSIPDYDTYADAHMYDVNIPGCAVPGARVFVGQRREGFFFNIGETFDLINTDPLGARDAEENILDDKNVTSLALEVPIDCLVGGNDPVIGGWATTSLPQAQVLDPSPSVDDPTANGGAWTQVSRLGSPVVNEVVIGLPDKDLFNASHPANDVSNFGTYVLFPTLPALVDVLFPVVAVPTTPRNDLLAAFVTGIRTTVNGAAFNFTQPQAIASGGGTPGEMLRLNTAIPATANPALGNLGFLDCDLAGFPNGRRPVDDVIDIELSVAMGAVGALDPSDPNPNPNGLQTCDVSGAAPLVVAGGVVTDGTMGSDDLFIAQFPYLSTPLPGSPFEASEP